MVKSIIINNKYFFYAMIVIASIVVFIGTYGLEIINPTYVEVYNYRGDWTQHYYGWVGFRKSDWQFPLGLYNYNTYPDNTSIIFTDSIPIFAIFFKIFRGILPAQFQYFGIFTLGCYIAQSLISARIFLRFTQNKIYSFISSMLLLFVPIMLHRTFAHEALSAQCLIIYMIETLLLAKETSNKKIFARIGICAVLAAGIHIYFILICGIVLIGIVVFLFLKKKYIEAIASLFEYLALSALCVWVEGGFSSGIDTTKDTAFELYSINLNTFYNPLNKSSILPSLPINKWGEGDTTAYLGLGIIVLVLVTLVSMVVSHNKVKEMAKRNNTLIVSIGVSAFVAFLFAILPTISINDRQLFSVNLPAFVESIMGNFRSHGRTIWVVVYLIMILVPSVLYKCMNKIVACIIVAICTIVQVIDLKGYLAYKYDFVAVSHREEKEIDTLEEAKRYVEDDTLKHVIIVNVDHFDCYEDKDDVYVWAIENDKTSNHIYLARNDEDKYNKRLQEALDNPQEDYLFILSLNDEELCNEYKLYYVKSGRYIFARSIPLN